jgi:hypothetical protein
LILLSETIFSAIPQGNDLLIGGTILAGSEFAVSRLTAGGTLDTTFGTAGRVLFTGSAVTSNGPSANSPSGVLSERDDDTFVYSGVVGASGSRSGFVANFSANGTLTPAFGSSSGELVISYGQDDPAYAMLSPEGGLVVDIAQYSSNSSAANFYYGSISAAGVLGTPLLVGTLPENGTLGQEWAYTHYVLQADGELIISGLTANGDANGPFNTEGNHAALWETNPGLTALVASFGSGGEFSLSDNTGTLLVPFSNFLTSDGKLLIAGFADVNGTADSIMLARYDLDTTTGNINGTVYDDLNTNMMQDPGEALANVPVYVDLTNVGHYVAGDPVTTTDVFGNYALTGLTPGTYTVRVDLALLPSLTVELPTVGSYTATVTADQTVTGDTFALATAPAATGIQVSYQGTDINDGENAPSLLTGTNFGSVSAGSDTQITYTISNPGSTLLTIGTPALPAGFTLVSAPDNSIPAGGTTTFTVGLTAQTTGTYSGDVSIANNDPTKTPYTFEITATVTGAVANPQSLTISPTTGTAVINATDTLTATVTGASGFPISGVSVLFTVTGANPSSTSIVTDANGDAAFTYSGANVGRDTIVAAVGRLTANAHVTRTLTAPAPTASAGGPYTITEGEPLTLDASDTTGTGTLTYTWDINGDGVYGDATGVTPTLTAAELAYLGIDSGATGNLYNVKVKVTDGTGATVTSAATTLIVLPTQTTVTTPTTPVNTGTTTPPVAPTPSATGTISGSVLNDVTGDGLSSDDTAFAGVTVDLYFDSNNNSKLDKADQLFASTVTNTAGQYSFIDPPVGRYFIKEVVPQGYLPTAPVRSSYYTVNVINAVNISNESFDNFELVPTSTISDVHFTANGRKIKGLSGARAGQTVTATFTINSHYPEVVSLASYAAPNGVFLPAESSRETSEQIDSGTFENGTYSLTITLPAHHYQVDFVAGAAMSHFGAAGSNSFYSTQHRLIATANK